MENEIALNFVTKVTKRWILNIFLNQHLIHSFYLFFLLTSKSALNGIWINNVLLSTDGKIPAFHETDQFLPKNLIPRIRMESKLKPFFREIEQTKVFWIPQILFPFYLLRDRFHLFKETFKNRLRSDSVEFDCVQWDTCFVTFVIFYEYKFSGWVNVII